MTTNPKREYTPEEIESMAEFVGNCMFNADHSHHQWQMQSKCADMLRSLASQLAAQKREGESTSWLVEHDGQRMEPKFGGLSWLTVRPRFEGFGKCQIDYTSNANEALRFSRKEDGELFLRLHIGDSPSDWYAKGFSVTEHAWIAPSSDQDREVSP